MIFIRRRCPWAVPLVFYSSILLADGIREIDRVTVTGHYDNGLGTSEAASEGTVTAKLLESRPVLRPAEVLEFIPGVIITQHSGDGKANQYFLRGFNLDHGTDFATTVAGMPVNLPTHAHGQGYTDLNFLIPELVRRVDYRKGPYFAEVGDFGSAGSAEIHYFDRLANGLAVISAGTHQFRRALLADSTPFGKGHFLYALEAQHHDGPWDHPNDARKVNAVLRYSAGPEDALTSITAMAYRGRWNATDQIPERALSAGLISRWGTIDATDGGRSSRYSISLDHLGRYGDSAFVINAYAMRYRLNLFSNFTYVLTHPFDLGDPIAGDQFEQADRRNTFGLNAKWRFPLHFKNREANNTFGLSLRHDDIAQVGLFSTVARERMATIRDDSVRQSSVGAYFDNRIAWLEKFRTVAGIRADFYRFRVDSSESANTGSASDHMVSPKFALILGPWARTEFYLNAGYGFHSNDARGTTIRVHPGTGERSDRVTPLARTRGAEFGLRAEPTAGLQTSLALWQLRLDSELVFVGDAGTTEASRPSKRSGIEWSAHYLPTPWLILDASLAASRARFTDADPAGEHIPGAVNRVASMGITVDKLRHWSGSLQWRYFGPRPLIEDGSRRSRSTSLFNFRIAYGFSPRWKLTVDMFNVFNRRANDIDYFYDSRLPGEPAEGVSDFHFHPVEKRSARISVSYRL